MAMPWLCYIVVLLFLSTNPTSGYPSDTNPGPQLEFGQLVKIIDDLNAAEERIFAYNYFIVQDAQKTADGLAVQLLINVRCLDGFNSQKCGGVNNLICSATLPVSEDGTTYVYSKEVVNVTCTESSVRESEKDEKDYLFGSVEQQSPTAKADTLQNQQQSDPLIELSHEITSQSSGEQFVALRRDSSAGCVGCNEKLSPEIEGVDELVDTALRHIASEHQQRHVLVKVLSLERQIVAGVKYYMVLEIAPEVCSDTAVSTKAKCVAAEDGGRVCLVEFYQRPWLKTQKHIVANNCTVEQDFVLTTKKNDHDNEISVLNHGYEDGNVDDEIIPLSSYEPMEPPMPNFEHMADTGTIEDHNHHMHNPDDVDLAYLEDQIVEDELAESGGKVDEVNTNRLDVAQEPPQSQPPTFTTTNRADSGIVQTTVDNSNIGVDDIPSIFMDETQTQTGSTADLIRTLQESAESDDWKDELATSHVHDIYIRNAQSSSEESNEQTRKNVTAEAATIKKQSSESDDSSEEKLKLNTTTIAVETAAVEVADDTLQKVKRDATLSSEESSEEQKKTPSKVKRDVSISSQESSEEKQQQPKVKREANKIELVSSEESSEEQKSPRVKRDTNAVSSEESSEEHTHPKAKRSTEQAFFYSDGHSMNMINEGTLKLYLHDMGRIVNHLQDLADSHDWYILIDNAEAHRDSNLPMIIRGKVFSCIHEAGKCVPNFGDLRAVKKYVVTESHHKLQIHEQLGRSRRGLVGGPNEVSIDDERIQNLTKASLSRLDAESEHATKYKFVEIVNATRQVVAGLLYRIHVRIVPSDCPKSNEDVDPQTCGELKEATPVHCELKIWDRPWLGANGREIQFACGPNVTHAAKSKRSVNFDETFVPGLVRLVDLLKFEQFQLLHDVHYVDFGEKLARLNVFIENMFDAKLMQRNERGTAFYGISPFADRTSAEYGQLLGLRPELASENRVTLPSAKIPRHVVLPEAFDWREKNVVTPVKNQGSCGSCWAFSVTGNVEGQYAIQSGRMLEFSEQELVDCDKKDSGCNGGLMDQAYEAIEELGGLETEEDYPYDAKNEKCHFDQSLVRVRVTGAVNISQDETEMAQWLLKNGPISIGINANAMQFYMGGVSHPWKVLCSPGSLDHGVLIIGFGKDVNKFFNRELPFWTVKNSWGKRWGEQGYYRVYRGDGTCGVNQMASSAIVEGVENTHPSIFDHLNLI